MAWGARGLSMKRQAFASWRWYNYTSSQAAPDKQLLRLNIDETSVSLYQGGKNGNVFINKAVKSKGRVPLWKRRCSLTHVAVVCDQPHIQPRLLQTLVGNWSAFPQKAMAGLRAESPPNVLLVRQRSAWNNQDLMALLIRMTGRILAMHAAGYQPVLLLDAARIHCTRKVLSAARAAGIWVVLIPAKSTWLLQPLDTHGFARYKEYLQKRYQDARIEHGGDLAISVFLQCVYDTIRRVLQGTRWSTAFDQNGYSAQQANVAGRVQEAMGVAGVAGVAVSRPCEADLALCFPKRTRVQPLARLLWSSFDAPAVSILAAPGATPPAVGSSPTPGSASVGSARAGPVTRAAARASRAQTALSSSSAGAASSSTAPAAIAIQPVFGSTRSATRALRAAQGASSRTG